MKDTNACTPPLQLSDNAASAAEESGSDEVRKQMMLKRVASHQLQTLIGIFAHACTSNKNHVFMRTIFGIQHQTKAHQHVSERHWANTT